MTLSLHDMNVRPSESILLYGIGNVGRQDDGMGVRLVERLERDAGHAWGDGGPSAPTTFETNYQLGLEDALLLARFDVVLFLDASREPSADSFTLRPLTPSHAIAFTTHAMSFSSVLAICEELYGHRPRTFLLAMHGYEWNIGERLSPRARIHVDEAFASLSVLLRSRRAPRGAIGLVVR